MVIKYTRRRRQRWPCNNVSLRQRMRYRVSLHYTHIGIITPLYVHLTPHTSLQPSRRRPLLAGSCAATINNNIISCRPRAATTLHTPYNISTYLHIHNRCMYRVRLLYGYCRRRGRCVPNDKFVSLIFHIR